MNKRAILILWLLFLLSLSEAKIPIAAKRYPVRVGKETLKFPYESSHDLSMRNEMIESLILSIHSSSYDAEMYFQNALAAMNKAGADSREYLIIAPHFLSGTVIQERISSRLPSDLLYWKVRPFWGSSQGFYNDGDVRISSFEVIDQILTEAVEGGNFPNLKTVVILGHSAGGQMVNRYAAGNQFEYAVARPKGIRVRYLVMAPSSYAYFTPERFFIDPKLYYTVPDNPPDGYDNWGYGLKNLYSYHRRCGMTPESIKERYPSRIVMYLVGDRDRDPDDRSLSKTAASMLQGKNRLHRGRIYFAYLEHVYGPDIKKTQRFVIVRGVGHSGRSLMTSDAGLDFIFGRRQGNPARESL